MPATQVLAALLVLVLVDHEAMVRIAFGPLLGVSSSLDVLLMAWGWLLLMIATMAALLRRPRWAIPLLVLLIPAGTVLLGISYLPFVLSLVPVSLRFYALIVANVAVLLVSVILLRRPVRERLQSAGGLTRS